MSKSINRVTETAKALGLDITVQTMPETTRSAADAAQACGCAIGQIVKSLVFEGTRSGALKLVLVSGRHDLNLDLAVEVFGEPLKRADPKRVRAETGFAIGGVSPLGHLTQPDTWMDQDLLQYQGVWAAAGTPNAVFCVDPSRLARVLEAQIFTNQS